MACSISGIDLARAVRAMSGSHSGLLAGLAAEPRLGHGQSPFRFEISEHRVGALFHPVSWRVATEFAA